MALDFVNKSALTQRTKTVDYSRGELFNPPRVHHSKVNEVRAVRRHISPPSRSLEGIEAVWSERRAGSLPNLVERRPEPESRPGPVKVMNPAENGCPGRGSRKRGFKPPDVRTIFSLSERNPRARGEGHTFYLGLSGAWCDVCWEYIPRFSLMCSGEFYYCVMFQVR